MVTSVLSDGLSSASVGVGLGKIVATVVWAARSAGLGVACFE